MVEEKDDKVEDVAVEEEVVKKEEEKPVEVEKVEAPVEDKKSVPEE